MTLDFLSPHPALETPARGPMLDAAIAAGASIELRDGWEVVSAFAEPGVEAAACEDTVGFADRSELTKLELQLPAARAGRGPGRGEVRLVEGGWHCPLRPDRSLVICEPALAATTSAVLRAGEGMICDLTASLGALAIAGPLAREAFARFCALDLREGSLAIGEFRPGSVARVPGLVLREGEERFLALFGAAQGEYVWETVADAVDRLGGRPVAATSLPPVATEAHHA